MPSNKKYGPLHQHAPGPLQREIQRIYELINGLDEGIQEQIEVQEASGFTIDIVGTTPTGTNVTIPAANRLLQRDIIELYPIVISHRLNASRFYCKIGTSHVDAGFSVYKDTGGNFVKEFTVHFNVGVSNTGAPPTLEVEFPTQAIEPGQYYLMPGVALDDVAWWGVTVLGVNLFDYRAGLYRIVNLDSYNPPNPLIIATPEADPINFVRHMELSSVSILQDLPNLPPTLVSPVQGVLS